LWKNINGTLEPKGAGKFNGHQKKLFSDRMKPIIGYIKKYFHETDKRVLAIISVLTGLLIFLNYYFGIDDQIDNSNSFITMLLGRSLVFFIAFGLPYMVYAAISRRPYFHDRNFLILLLLAPAIFSLKVALNPSLPFSDSWRINNFWNHVFYWPALLIITGSILFIIWKISDRDQPFYGIRTKQMNWKPYIIMLLIMVPLIAAASTQPDFLAVYPKLKLVADIGNIDELPWWQKLLFELSYGSDFITIELFFRGFLILAFIKWAGKDAILPMACFYCTIHFGKPLGECISSYFGGIILGIVVYHTRSILGGLMVHLGIAWLMEVGGYIGQ
jgi:hypothetical protein